MQDAKNSRVDRKSLGVAVTQTPPISQGRETGRQWPIPLMQIAFIVVAVHVELWELPICRRLVFFPRELRNKSSAYESWKLGGSRPEINRTIRPSTTDTSEK